MVQFCYLTLYLSIETVSRLTLLSGFARILKVAEFKKKNSRPWKTLKIAVSAGRSLNFSANFIVKLNSKEKGANAERPSRKNYSCCGRTKKGIDSRLFFALNGVLEKWEMCPWTVLELFVQKRVQTLCYGWQGTWTENFLKTGQCF